MLFTDDEASRVYDRSYFGVKRRDATIFVDVRPRRGRSGLSPGDLFITLFENGSEDCSFGDGVAQMAPAEVAAG